MTNAKTTKRALLSSIVSLILCFTMLLSTTYAWFTDTVTSANNIITAGNLDIELEYAVFNEDGTFKEWETVNGSDKLFSEELWEPGHTEVVYLKLSNLGTLALKYQLGINITETIGTNVADAPLQLSKYIYMGVVKDAKPAYGSREVAIEAAKEGINGIIGNGYTESGTMLGKTANATVEQYMAVVVYMPDSVGNEANYKTGTTPPEINLGINLIATQMTKEEDSFGNDYDDGAFIPVAPEALPEAGESLELKGSAESEVAVTVPASVVAGLDANVTSLTVAASAPIVDTTNKTVTFTTIELQDQNGKEVDLSNANAKVTVTLPVNGAFADGEQVEIYHDGSFVTYATVAEGKISYEVSHFCEVSIKAAEEVVLDNTIDSVKEFLAFAAAVNAGNSYKGQTVVLGADLDLAGVTWTPIGTSANPFKGTFDGNGKVIKNLSVLMAGKSNVGLFGYTTDGEIKNVTVENAKIAGRLYVGVVAGTPYTTKYTNITVKGHVEVDGMAYVGTVGGKNAYADWTNVTVNVDATSYVNANSVENGNAYRTYVGGVVGFNGEGGHTFSNITSNINVLGSTCDVGGAFGIAHYNNKFENVTVTGNVEIYAAEEAAEAEEIGGIAGVWHNENGTSVTFTDCTFTGKLTANVAADLSNNTIAGAAYNKTGNGTLVIDSKAYVAVNTGDELKAALADNKNVIFVDNITMAATESNAYGVTGINVKNGQTIDGNGYTLKVTGAGATWASAISTTGGLIKNLTVAQGFRGIFINHNSTYSETVVLDNVTIHGPTYTISCDQGMKQNLVAINCTINGWTSYAATVGTATFTNCSFGKGAGYQFCRPYAATEFENCTFSAGYVVDEANAKVAYSDCNYMATTSEELQTLINRGASNIILGKGEFTAELYTNNASRDLTITGQGADTTLNFKNQQVRLALFDKLTIDNCTMGRMVDKSWGQIVFGSSTQADGIYTISNCIFNGIGTQGIYINQNVAATFNIENCTFNGNFGGEGAITIQNNENVDITVNVTGCSFKNIPESSHEIYMTKAYKGWTLNAVGVNAYWKAV